MHSRFDKYCKHLCLKYKKLQFKSAPLKCLSQFDAIIMQWKKKLLEKNEHLKIWDKVYKKIKLTEVKDKK